MNGGGRGQDGRKQSETRKEREWEEDKSRQTPRFIYLIAWNLADKNTQFMIPESRG